MEKQVSEADVTINAPVDTVWRAITQSEIALMPGATVESSWQVGDAITFSGDWNGKPFKDYGQITDRVEKRTVAFSHWSGTPKQPEDFHIVRYRLEDRGDATHVSLTQTNVGPHAEVDAATKAEFDQNWRTMLDHLKKAAEAG